MAVSGADLHVIKRVADIRVTHLVQPHRAGIVWLNGHKGDATISIIRYQLFQTRLVQLRRRTVIASEGDDQQLALGIVLETVLFVVDSR